MTTIYYIIKNPNSIVIFWDYKINYCYIVTDFKYEMTKVSACP